MTANEEMEIDDFDKGVESVLDGVEEDTAKYEGELWLSTDGKHSVHIKADTTAGRREGADWAMRIYKRIVANLGTKPELWEKAMNGNYIKCSICGKPALEKSGISKTGKSWKGIFCNEDKEHVQWIR